VTRYVEERRDAFGVEPICRTLGVPVSTHYARRSRKPSARELADRELLVEIEAAFKNLKDDLGLRPIYHQLEQRIEAHIFVAFMAYCLHVTLGRRLRDLAPGLTPHSVLEKLAAMQMIDVHLPTTDGREVVLTRYTQPEPEQRLLLAKLKLEGKAAV